MLLLLILVTNILNLKCGQWTWLESEYLTRFQNWSFVQSMRLKTVNILKLINILNNLQKLWFVCDYDADERACRYVLCINPHPPIILEWSNNFSVYCNIFCKSTTDSYCSCRYLAYGIHLAIWDKQQEFQFDPGLAFGTVVRSLVVLVDLKSLGLECFGTMPWE